ncbi:MAG: amidohydrolase family protein [Planctomycetota bacterium]
MKPLLAGAALALFAGAVAADKLVIQAGKILTLAGEEIENGVILIENGRIAAIGAANSIETPWDATVIGGPEHVAMPGFVEAHSNSGMDRTNENIDVAPFLDIRDSVDPVAYYFEDCLRWGITTVNLQQGWNCVVGGQGMIVRPHGMTVEAMMMRPTYGLKLSARPKSGKSRATQAQALRTAFGDLRRYLEDLVQSEKDERGFAKREALFQGRDLEGEKSEGKAMTGKAWTVAGLELIPRGAIDEKQAPLLDVVEGNQTIYFECDRAMDVDTALSIARDNGFLEKTVLVVDADCWEAFDAIAAAGVPVVLDGELVHMHRDPLSGEETEKFAAGILAEKGIPFALTSRNSSTQSLWFQAAKAVGFGLDREDALAAVTSSPAAILGVDVGTLETGKLGNIVLMTGDPLKVTSLVDHVVIEGAHVYDRSKDVRNKQLLDGTQPSGTQAEPTPTVAKDEE